MDMDISIDIHVKSVGMDGYGWEISYTTATLPLPQFFHTIDLRSDLSSYHYRVSYRMTEHTVSSRFAETRFAETRLAEIRVKG